MLFGTAAERPLGYRKFEMPMFLDPPEKIVPYTRFLDARGRRKERLTGLRTLAPIDPDSSVLLASTGTAVQQAAVLAVLPAVAADPSR